MKNKEMTNNLQVLKELFQDRKFYIPSYQRAYAWEKKQIIDLIEDIRYQKMNVRYYMGTIILQSEDENSETFNLVDGQQRITSIILFVKAVTTILENRKFDVNKYKQTYLGDKNYKLELLTNENEVFKKVMKLNGCENNITTTTLSQERLINAYKTIYLEMENESDENLLNYLNIIDNIEVLVYIVKDEVESSRIFETTNDRGKSLNELDKMKSFFMYKIYSFNIKQEDKKSKLLTLQTRFENIFKSVADLEGDLARIGLEENSILKSHFVAYYDWKYLTEKVEVFNEEGIPEVDEDGKQKYTIKRIKQYNNHLQTIKKQLNLLAKENKTEEIWEFIDSYSEALDETFSNLKEILRTESFENMQKLQTLGRLAKFMPIILKTYKYDNSPDKSNFEEINRIIELFAFRVLGIGSKYAYTGESSFYDFAKAFMNKNKELIDIKKEFEDLKNDMINLIKWYEGSYKFEELLKDSQMYNNKRNIAKYLLWQYENDLRDKSMTYRKITKKEYNSKDSRKKYTIEHIIPQDYEKHNMDNVIYSKSLKIDLQKKEFEDNYLHCIGNLVLDTHASNSSKGAKSENEKQEKYFNNSNFITQQLLENYVADKKWNKDSIITRMNDIVKFAKERWKIQ